MPSRMRFRTGLFATRISKAATMPPPMRGTNLCAMTAPSASGELDPDLLLAESGEHIDDPVDRLSGIVGVQGREDEVTGLGQRERELNRLEVTHLTDEEDIGVLSESGAERPLEGGAVDADLSLVDGGKLVSCGRTR